MAGYIFSISSKLGLSGVKKCIYQGTYASTVPNEALPQTGEDGGGIKGKQVAAAVLTDYCSMKAGDNVYFLSDRKIYGIGKLVNLGEDCKYKNYKSAHILECKKDYNEEDAPLTDLSPEYRWICFFEPEQQFFTNGVDMDEVLQYKPSAFKMLRAFQDTTFIKIDDEENRALKECLYLKNRKSSEFFEFSDNVHKKIMAYDLRPYAIDVEQILRNEYNAAKEEVSLEMLLEAWTVDKIVKEGFEGQYYDYVSHQVIASPFKPLAFIDRMDVFAYKFLEKYPDAEKPIEQYLVIELKKGKANKELPLQLMRYVDWISTEYASGDYSLIKAVGIAKSYTKGMQSVLDTDCIRSYLSDIHPNKTSVWNDLQLYEYYFDEAGSVQCRKTITFEVKTEIKKYLEELGLEVTTTEFTIKRKKYKPLLKVQEKKWAIFEKIDDETKMNLEMAGWKVTESNSVKCKNDVIKMISSLFLEKDLYK